MSLDTGSDHGGGDDIDSDFATAVLGGNVRDPGLGLLLDMAKRGEYDPWNIDIVALTDRYLVALDETLDARDLSHVARLIFYAAALVHLKAKALADREARLRQQDSLSLDAQMDELADALRGRQGLLPGDLPLLYPDFFGEGAQRGGVGGLMPRERRPRERGLTLVDLIAALRTYDERLAQEEAERAATPELDYAVLGEECVNSGHQDDLDRDIVEVRQDLWRLLAQEDTVLPFEALLEGGRTKAGAYLALLFLAQDEEIVLEQQVTYGALHVKRGPFFGQIRAGVKTEDTVELESQPETEIEPETEAAYDDAGARADEGAGARVRAPAPEDAPATGSACDTATEPPAAAPRRVRRKRNADVTNEVQS